MRAGKGPSPQPSPASGEREGPAKREGEGQTASREVPYLLAFPAKAGIYFAHRPRRSLFFGPRQAPTRGPV
jgi:hypothetical protein